MAVVDNDVADAVVSTLRKFPQGAAAACIGEVVGDHAGQVVLTSSIGGRRIVNMLIGEQLPRIC